MKTTVEIADDLFQRAQNLARKENTTFRAIAEEGLRLVLRKKAEESAPVVWTPVTYGGTGVSDDFRDWSWDKVRNAIYDENAT